jgi:hypothetical protein
MSAIRLTAALAASPPICASRIANVPGCVKSVTTHGGGPQPAPAAKF